MDRKYRERSLLQFQKDFATEEGCAKHLAEQRWPEGFVCPHCGHREAWYIRTRRVFDCKRCRKKTSVTAGTIFHKTRTSLVKWYWLLYRMSMGKVGVSVAEMQRLLDIGQYKTAWLMGHKIRAGMAERDARYTLAGLIEMDETFLGPSGESRGRGSEHKSIILCAISLYRDRKGRERPGFARMTVVNDVSAKTIEQFLEKLGCGAATQEGKQLLEAIRTDGWRSYSSAAKSKGMTHYRVVLREPEQAGNLLPWVHRLITNAKSVISGTHRGVSEKHLQAYLGEICYRFNRRFWERELFDRLIQASVAAETITYDQLVGKKEP